MKIDITIDFDGTVTLGDVTQLVLERFADPKWLEVEAEWVAGRIGSRECLARQAALLSASPGEIDALLDAVKSVRAALEDFYATLTDEQKAQFEAIGPRRSA